ncbi:CLUMA_CG008122, isoform A [Clunio marinus]|uniref:CLUMA_CG008122, isoform A n=1 Tax=Clunio marinus TaxID=568069 RepID=A0A1J1I6P8_9DIPT|nr:CLUMA_CG008122, isoform A [Clunio marinus]
MKLYFGFLFIVLAIFASIGLVSAGGDIVDISPMCGVNRELCDIVVCPEGFTKKNLKKHQCCCDPDV